jgi:hypothetical protein
MHSAVGISAVHGGEDVKAILARQYRMQLTLSRAAAADVSAA